MLLHFHTLNLKIMNLRCLLVGVFCLKSVSLLQFGSIKNALALRKLTFVCSIYYASYLCWVAQHIQFNVYFHFVWIVGEIDWKRFIITSLYELLISAQHRENKNNNLFLLFCLVLFIHLAAVPHLGIAQITRVGCVLADRAKLIFNRLNVVGVCDFSSSFAVFTVHRSQLPWFFILFYSQ